MHETAIKHQTPGEILQHGDESSDVVLMWRRQEQNVDPPLTQPPECRDDPASPDVVPGQVVLHQPPRTWKVAR